ncbi:MAG: hypothetical protein WB014_06170 [Methanosarcina sp.]
MEPKESGNSAETIKDNRELIYKALIDPKFRKQLQENPAKALGVEELSDEKKNEIRFVLAAVKGISIQISSLADELLCANGGPCGIA